MLDFHFDKNVLISKMATTLSIIIILWALFFSIAIIFCILFQISKGNCGKWCQPGIEGPSTDNLQNVNSQNQESNQSERMDAVILRVEALRRERRQRIARMLSTHSTQTTQRGEFGTNYSSSPLPSMVEDAPPSYDELFPKRYSFYLALLHIFLIYALGKPQKFRLINFSLIVNVKVKNEN